MGDSPVVDAVILAGGQGRRLGRGEKGLVPVAGRPLITHVAARIAGQMHQGAISANRCLGEYRHCLDWPLLLDAPHQQGAGPLAGMAAGLRFFSQADWVLMVPCDTPLVPIDLVSRLLAASSAQHDIVYAADHQRSHYAVTLMRPGLSASLDAALASGTRRLQAFHEQHHALRVVFDEAGAFININTAAELDDVNLQFST